MTTPLVLVGTRKGLFLLEGDAERRSFELRGPFCDSWPIYHAIYDPGSDSIYAAAASEWHGAGIWRSRDRGATWSLSSEGLSYPEGEGRVSKLASLAATPERLLAGAEAPGIFESRDGGEHWTLLTRLEGLPGSESWGDPASQPPGHLGISALIPDVDDPSHLRTIVQGVGIFESHDGGSVWQPRNRGLRADWPRPHEEVGFCVHKLVVSPDPTRLYQQNHCGVHRSDDAGASWQEITEGLPSDFGFAAAAHPHDPDTVYVIPLDPGHARCMHDGAAAVWRTRDGGERWERLADGLPQRDAHLGVLRGAMAIDGRETPGIYVGTTTGQLFASGDGGERWQEVASYLPPIWSVEAVEV